MPTDEIIMMKQDLKLNKISFFSSCFPFVPIYSFVSSCEKSKFVFRRNLDNGGSSSGKVSGGEYNKRWIEYVRGGGQGEKKIRKKKKRKDDEEGKKGKIIFMSLSFLSIIIT